MPKDKSVAPKERINLVYESKLGGQEAQRELPLKILSIGDYTGSPDDRALADRKPINVNKVNFKDVMAAQKLSVEVSVPDRLSGEEDAEIGGTLTFESLDDFTPEGIANQVPELQRLLALREALVSVRASVSNPSAFLKKLKAVVKDENQRNQLIAELSKAPPAAAAAPEPPSAPEAPSEPESREGDGPTGDNPDDESQA